MQNYNVEDDAQATIKSKWKFSIVNFLMDVGGAIYTTKRLQFAKYLTWILKTSDRKLSNVVVETDEDITH